jgi:transposase-like protein
VRAGRSESAALKQAVRLLVIENDWSIRDAAAQLGYSKSQIGRIAARARQTEDPLH